jgi:AcrR family transcriptional regulator
VAVPTTRRTADERRTQLVAAAIEEFAQAGLAGASTEAIARRAGISHAYLFRLFGTKRELFLAAIDASHDHVLQVFRDAEAARAPDEPQLKALGAAYGRMIEDRRELLFQFHEFAACGDDDIRERVRLRYREVFDWVRRVSGRPDDEVRLFMSAGLLLAVASAIGDDVIWADGSFIADALDAALDAAR